MTLVAEVDAVVVLHHRPKWQSRSSNRALSNLTLMILVLHRLMPQLLQAMRSVGLLLQRNMGSALSSMRVVKHLRLLAFLDFIERHLDYFRRLYFQPHPDHKTNANLQSQKLSVGLLAPLVAS